LLKFGPHHRDVNVLVANVLFWI